MIKTAIIISSFWGNSKHVGNYRIERFIRWLNKLDYQITLINSGTRNSFQEKKWGSLITVKNPFLPKKKFSENKLNNKKFLSVIKSIISKLVYFWIFIPDSNILWALLVPYNKIVKKYVDKKADFIISSSPPESDHIAALFLSKKNKTKLIVDLRDGWLDEPLKPLLKKYAVRRIMERIPEYFVYKNATAIFVTSNEWEKILKDRNPSIGKQTRVLTNAYPVNFDFKKDSISKKNEGNSISIFHSGRFRLSSGSRHLSILLDPIILASNNFEFNAKIKLRGEFNGDDLNELEKMRSKCQPDKIEILKLDYIERDLLLNEIKIMDGLLLLSTSKYALPSKLFEYIPTSKPLLIMCPEGSAVWNLCKTLPQAFLFDYTLSNEFHKENVGVIYDFLMACKHKNFEVSIPTEFSEDFLFSKFKMEINN